MRRSLAALLLVAASASAQPADLFTSGEQGFRIRKPASPWKLTEATPAPGTSYTLKIARIEGATETSVTLFVADLQGLADANAACDAAAKARKLDAKISALKLGKGDLAGETAPWMRFRYQANVPYTLRQHFLVHHDALFVIQCAAPEESFESAEDEFKPYLESFEFIPLADADGRKDRELLRNLTARCGSEIDWAPTWAAAAARAKKENRLVLVVVEQYRGLNIERYAPSTLFMDSDAVALVQERFVAFAWNDRCGAPFEKPEVYGLGPSTFGQGLLFVDAEGGVVGEGESFDPFYFVERAGQVLREHPGAAPRDGDDVEELLRRGDLVAADARLKEPKTADDWLRKADLLRRRRLGPEALKALASAKAAGGRGLELEEAVIRIRMGEFAEAEKLLAANETPEAVFWHALSRGMKEGLEPVRAEVVKLAREHPDDRWAWRAAAVLCGKGMASGLDRAAWHDEERLAKCLPAAGEPVDDAARAERDAIAFLLRSQLRDGSWPSPHSLVETRGGSAVAIASIAGVSLLPFRERDDVAAALRRALDFVLANPLATQPGRLFDYTIWGQIFSLRFLAACVEAKFGDREALVEAMDELVAEMKRGRFADGGWAYFKAEGSDGASIGFVTAAAVCALLEAKAAGADVPGSLVEKAAAFVASTKQEGGAFGYFAAGGGQAGRGAEAAFRSPLYALALKRTGKGDVAGIRASLDLYMEHREHDLRERGKNLCHTSPEGLASYYLLFGCAFATEALDELPEKERAKYRAALIEDVLSMRTADGGFCDNPGVGRHYGAAMALRVLRP